MRFDRARDFSATRAAPRRLQEDLHRRREWLTLRVSPSDHLRRRDTVVVWSPDRFGRSLGHLLETVRELQVRKGEGSEAGRRRLPAIRLVESEGSHVWLSGKDGSDALLIDLETGAGSTWSTTSHQPATSALGLAVRFATISQEGARVERPSLLVFALDEWHFRDELVRRNQSQISERRPSLQRASAIER